MHIVEYVNSNGALYSYWDDDYLTKISTTNTSNIITTTNNIIDLQWYHVCYL